MAQKKAGAAPAGLTPPKEISEAEELRRGVWGRVALLLFLRWRGLVEGMGMRMLRF